LCREDGKEISSRFENELFKKGKLIGIIKEVAPVAGAKTDAELGVGEFQTEYFNNNPLYMDSKKEFYTYLGDKSLLSQPLSTWNPFKLYSDFKSLTARLETKKVTGNLKGEGLLKGGILIVHPTRGLLYTHEENTGSEMPYDEIMAAFAAACDEGSGH
jgi:hypothetical protein